LRITFFYSLHCNLLEGSKEDNVCPDQSWGFFFCTSLFYIEITI